MARNVAVAHCFSDHAAEVRFMSITSTGAGTVAGTGTGAVFDNLFSVSSWAQGGLNFTSNFKKLTLAE